MLSKNIDKDPKDAAEFEEFVSTNYLDLLMTLSITYVIGYKGPVLQEPESDAVVKMRGLPFEAGPAEIVRFFEGRCCFVNN